MLLPTMPIRVLLSSHVCPFLFAIPFSSFFHQVSLVLSSALSPISLSASLLKLSYVFLCDNPAFDCLLSRYAFTLRNITLLISLLELLFQPCVPHLPIAPIESSSSIYTCLFLYSTFPSTFPNVLTISLEYPSLSFPFSFLFLTAFLPLTDYSFFSFPSSLLPNPSPFHLRQASLVPER